MYTFGHNNSPNINIVIAEVITAAMTIPIMIIMREIVTIGNNRYL